MSEDAHFGGACRVGIALGLPVRNWPNPWAGSLTPLTTKFPATSTPWLASVPDKPRTVLALPEPMPIWEFDPKEADVKVSWLPWTPTEIWRPAKSLSLLMADCSIWARAACV